MKIPSPDDLRTSYDELHARGTFESSQISLDWCRRHGPWPSKRVLDVGCGGGDFLAVARNFGADVHGLDISPVAISEAKELLAGADIRAGIAQALPWEDAFFDWVVCFGTLEHLTDPEQGIREMARVCKPDGRIYIHLPNCYWWRCVTWAWRRGEGPDNFQPWEWFLPRAEWERLLRQNGLHVLKAESWRPPIVWNPLRFRDMIGSFIEAMVPLNLASGFGFLTTPQKSD